MFKEKDNVTWGNPAHNNFGTILRIVGDEAEIEYFPYMDRMVLLLSSLRLATILPPSTNFSLGLDGVGGGF